MVFYNWAVLAARQALDEGGNVNKPRGESRAADLYGFMFSFWPLALIAVILRFYTRLRFAKLGWDDITIAIAFVLYTGLIIATIMGKPVPTSALYPMRVDCLVLLTTPAAMKYGLGVHIWEVRRETEQQMQKVINCMLCKPLLHSDPQSLTLTLTSYYP